MLYFVRKEVLVISISTAVLVNLVVTRRFLRAIHLLPLTSNEVMEQVRIQYFTEFFVVELEIIAILKELTHISVMSIYIRGLFGK